MFDYIKNAGLISKGIYRERMRTELIVLHHVEGDMSVGAVHELHRARGHKGIDYNIYIDKDGGVYWGRGLEFEGGHVLNGGKTAGINARSVGIVCNGNFKKESMGFAQYEALKKVLLDLAIFYKIDADNIKTHRELGDTDCPGDKFPIGILREYVGEEMRARRRGWLYETAVKTPVYKKNRTISAGVRLELECYSGGEYARVLNPKTGNEFLVRFADLIYKS